MNKDVKVFGFVRWLVGRGLIPRTSARVVCVCVCVCVCVRALWGARFSSNRAPPDFHRLPLLLLVLSQGTRPVCGLMDEQHHQVVPPTPHPTPHPQPRAMPLCHRH